MSTPCCACVSVRYEPIETGPCTYRERWRCESCGSEFVRGAAHERVRGNTVRALALLRDFYLAFSKEAWAEGETLESVLVDVRIFLDQATEDGWLVASLDDARDQGGTGEGGDR